MAVLGSTVDPRLGAVSPAALQALSQAGAASGQMYSNIGSSIAGVIQDFKSKKDDSSLQQAYFDSLKIDKDGNQKVDRKAFLEAVKTNKVSSRLANAYLKNELEISSMQNAMDIQNKMAGYEGQRVGLEGQRVEFEKARVGLEDRRVGMAEDAQELAGEVFAFEKEFKEGDQKLRISQWASDNLMDMQKLKAMREANTITQKQYNKDYKLAKKRYDVELKKLDQSEDLTRAQVKALKAESLLKKKEADLTQTEIDSYKDTDIGLGSEETMNNKLVGVLGIGDRGAQWDPLSPLQKAEVIREKLEGAKQHNLNMNTPRMVELQKAFDFFNEDTYLKGIPMPETAATIPQNQSLRDKGLSSLASQTRPYDQSGFYGSPGYHQ